MSLPARAQATFEVRCASALAPDHPTSVRLTQMWNAIQKESGGRIRARFFPASALGGDAAMVSQLRVGAIQFMILSPGPFASIVPAAEVGYLGFAFKDVDEGLRVMDGPVGAYLRTETEAKGLHALRTCWDAGMVIIGAAPHPIRTPEDFRGFKIRVPEGRISVDLFKALGASPTPLSINEVYPSLQTRLIDGEVASLVVIQTFRWFEVERYISLTNHQWAGDWILGNGDFWKSLPADLQELIERNNTTYAKLERRDMKLINASLVDKVRRQGNLVNEVDQAPFRALLGSYYQYWANVFGPTEWGLLQTALGRKLS